MYVREESLPVHRLDTDYITKTARELMGPRQPRVENAWAEFTRLDLELLNINNRLESATKSEATWADRVRDVERPVKLKKELIKKHGDDTEQSIQDMVWRLSKELAELETDLRALKDRHQGAIRVLGACKARLQEFPADRHAELKALFKKIKEAEARP